MPKIIEVGEETNRSWCFGLNNQTVERSDLHKTCVTYIQTRKTKKDQSKTKARYLFESSSFKGRKLPQ